MDKNNQNPFENIEQRINNHFKKNKKIPKTSEPVNLKMHMKKIITFTIIFAAFVILFANVYVVKENEYRVVRQFGEVVEIRFEPGIYMKVPFLQNVTSLPRYQMTYNVSEAEINTKDKKRIIIDNYAVWRITNPKEMITNAGTLLNAEARMEEFIYSVVRTELGQLAYDEIINDENTSRGSLNDRVTERVNELLKSDNYGVEVIDVRMKRTDLPPENEQSVYTRMISERESIAQKYLSEGDADKRTIEAATDRKVQEMVAIAKKEASIITAEAESEAAKIYNESFSKDPEFYALYRTLESYKKTIGKDTMIILPSDSPYAKILTGYLE